MPLSGTGRVRAGNLCRLGPGEGERPEFVVWGDSHADAWMPGFKALANQVEIDGWFASYRGCPPLLGVRRADKSDVDECREFNDAMIAAIRQFKIQNVVLIARWSTYASGRVKHRLGNGDVFLADEQTREISRATSQMTFERGLSRTLSELHSMGVNVWFLEQVPELTVAAPSALVRLSIAGRPLDHLAPTLDSHKERQAYVSEVLDRLEAEFEFTRIDPASQICAAQKCAMQHSGRSLYYDHHHLSGFGAQYLISELKPILVRAPTN